MSKKKESQPIVTASKESIYAFARFFSSLIVLLLLAVADLYSHETVPTIVYLLVGGLNGVDGYKLLREVQKS